MGNKYSTKQALSLQTNKTCIYQVVQLNNVELATCSSERNIDIWNLETGLIDITLTGYSTPVTSLVYMHDGRLASGSLEKSIKIWTYDTHRCDFTVMAHEGPIRALIQLKNHNLASGSDDKSIKILDLSSMWFCATFKDHKGPVKALAELLDERLVSGSADKTIKIWNVKRKKIEGTVDIGEVVTSLLVVNKSGLLLVGCKKIKVFNMSNREVYNNIFDLTGHNTEINNMINIGLDGERVISAGKGSVKIWNIPRKTLERKLDAHVGGTYGMEIMTDGSLVTSGGDGQLKVWNIVEDNGNMINLKTGQSETVKNEEKPIEAYNKVGKVTYAYKDDIKRHDLNKIEQNINQNKINNNTNKNNNNSNPFRNSINKSNNINNNNNNNGGNNKIKEIFKRFTIFNKDNSTNNNNTNTYKNSNSINNNSNLNKNKLNNSINSNTINSNKDGKTIHKSKTSTNLTARAKLEEDGWVFL